MKQFFMWSLILIMLVVLLIYSMGKLTDARTDQIFARAHLVEVKSDARTDYINSMMPLVTMLLSIAVVASMVVVIIAIIVVGCLAGLALMKYLFHHQQTQAALVQPALPAPTTIVVHVHMGEGASLRQTYKKLSKETAFIIDGASSTL